MADKDTKEDTFIGLMVTSMVLCIIAFILLLVGGIIYNVDIKDERLYKESTCRILAMQREEKSCILSSRRTTCKVTTWTVQHSGPTFINATIEWQHGSWMSDSAIERVISYNVRKSADCDGSLTPRV